MTVYMYAAAFHCEECGEEIRKDLARAATRKALETLDMELKGDLVKDKQLLFDLEDMVIESMESQTVDTDDWPASYPDAGESDCPQNCDSCGKPLEYSLTNVGVAYVVEAVRETLELGRSHYCRVYPSHRENDYYEGSPLFRVVADWVEDLRYYNLDEKDARMFRFVEWMERVYDQKVLAERMAINEN